MIIGKSNISNQEVFDSNATTTISNATTDHYLNAQTTEDEYDSEGAMIFTIAVVVIYGSSILAFIAYSVKSSSASSGSANDDRETEKFLNSQRAVDRQSAMKEVTARRKHFVATGLIKMAAVPLSKVKTIPKSSSMAGMISHSESDYSVLSDSTVQTSTSEEISLRRQLLLPEPTVLLTIPG